MADNFLTFLSALFGWIYFLAWSASFYPQALLNWRRRSTSGTTVDFPFINLLGESVQEFKRIAILHIFLHPFSHIHPTLASHARVLLERCPVHGMMVRTSLDRFFDNVSLPYRCAMRQGCLDRITEARHGMPGITACRSRWHLHAADIDACL